MEPQVERRQVDRRQLVDRRRQPTSLRSTLRLQGRRRGFRRAGEGTNAYVDCLTPRVIGLVALIVVSSALDAALTLLHLQNGGQEANPCMAFILVYGQAPFVSVKMALTGMGVWCLAAHQQFSLALRALHVLAGLYLALLGYHLFLFADPTW